MGTKIVTDPSILGGKPIIRGTRISVEMILEWIASGASPSEIVASYPQLSLEDVQAAAQYAARMLRDTEAVEVEIAH